MYIRPKDYTTTKKYDMMQVYPSGLFLYFSVCDLLIVLVILQETIRQGCPSNATGRKNNKIN